MKFLYKSCFLFLSLILTLSFSLPLPLSAQTAKKQTQIRYTEYQQRNYLSLDDIAKLYGMKFSFTQTGAILYSQASKVDFTYNKRAGTINGLAVHFVFPMLIKNGKGYISEIDFKNLLEPVFRPQTLKKHPIKTIMIDPGHGGTDNGAPGPVQAEKAINLSIARKLKTALEKKGYTVIMTRNTDITLSLDDRIAICEKRDPDLFISVHCNSTTTKSVDGIETYLATPKGGASTSDSTVSDAAVPSTKHDPNNYRLAYEIHRALISSTKANDRGVKHAKFKVIRNATCPGVLIETGFLSNDREGKMLTWKERQDNIVAAIVLGITRYSTAIK